MARKPRKQRPETRVQKPRQIAGTGSIVMSILRNKRSDIVKLKKHILERTPDGWSKIYADRSDRNEVLHGSGDVLKDVKQAETTIEVRGHKRDTDSPYLTLVIGASPEFFRPKGGPPGSEIETKEDAARLKAWKDRNLAFLKERFGNDLVSVVYHGDETTPHIHAVIIPTYDRRPGQRPRRKSMETDADHVARIEAWEALPTTRTRSWSSNAVIGRHNSAELVRREYADAMKPMGLEYALASFDPADPPTPMTTKQFVVETSQRIRDRDRKSQTVMERAQAVMDAAVALASEVSENTLSLDERGRVLAASPDALRGGMPEIKTAMMKMATAAAKLQDERAEVAKDRDQLTKDKATLVSDREALTAKQTRVGAELALLTAERSAVAIQLERLKTALRGVKVLARRWGLLNDPKFTEDLGTITKTADEVSKPAEKPSEESTRLGF